MKSSRTHYYRKSYRVRTGMFTTRKVSGHYARRPRRASSDGGVGALVALFAVCVVGYWLIQQWWFITALAVLTLIGVWRLLKSARIALVQFVAWLRTRNEPTLSLLAIGALAGSLVLVWLFRQPWGPVALLVLIGLGLRHQNRRNAIRRAAEASAARAAAAARSRHIPNSVKIAASLASGGVCAHCGSDYDLAFDHIVPFSRGGSSTDPDNIQILCKSCNSRKRDRFVG